MKKILMVVVSVLVVGCLIFIWKDELFGKRVDNNSSNLNDVKKNNVSTDLFGQYYDDAEKIMKDMTLEEKIGQLFLVRYDKNLASSWVYDYHPGGFIMFAKDFDNHTKDSIKEEIDNADFSANSLFLHILCGVCAGVLGKLRCFWSFACVT